MNLSAHFPLVEKWTEPYWLITGNFFAAIFDLSSFNCFNFTSAIARKFACSYQDKKYGRSIQVGFRVLH